jgi:hypothetical protein
MKGTNPKDLIGATKPNLFLVPPVAKIHMAAAMSDGAVKYGPYNWRGNKVQASIYLAAAERHMAAWLDGEQNAKDSGVHHLGHAMACLGIVLDAEETGNLVDDRPVAGAASRLLESLTKISEAPVTPTQAGVDAFIADRKPKPRSNCYLCGFTIPEGHDRLMFSDGLEAHERCYEGVKL